MSIQQPHEVREGTRQVAAAPTAKQAVEQTVWPVTSVSLPTPEAFTVGDREQKVVLGGQHQDGPPHQSVGPRQAHTEQEQKCFYFRYAPLEKQPEFENSVPSLFLGKKTNAVTWLWAIGFTVASCSQ